MVAATALVALAACGGSHPVVDALADGAPIDAVDALPVDIGSGFGFLVSGSALGIRGPRELQLVGNGISESVFVTEDGAFHFPVRVPDGTYTLGFAGSPPCRLGATTVVVADADVDSIQLLCDGVVELQDLSVAIPFSTPVVLAPPFDPAATTFFGTHAQLLQVTDTIVVTPTAAYPAVAAITVDGVTATSGQPTPVALGTALSVALTHPLGFSRTYTVTLTGRRALAQEAYVKASNTTADYRFGSVALSADTLVVGAPREGGTAASSGAVYVFRRNGTTWTQEQYLKASNPGTGDAFGTTVAIDGDTVIVGAPGEASGNGNQADNSAASAGAAYIFVRSGTTWSQQAYLKASTITAGDKFGAAVGISGDSVVIGALQESAIAASSGAAYVFVRSGTTWSQQSYLKASNAGASDLFGSAVAISGDSVAIGAPNEDGSGTLVNPPSNNNATDAGAAYVFTRSGTAWSQQAYIKASNTDASDAFGSSVAIDGDTLAVGAPGEASATAASESDNSKPGAGAVYVYQRVGTAWSKDAYLKASNPCSFCGFGNATALDRLHVIVGAYQEASSTTGVNSTPNTAAGLSGAAYVFERTATWTQLDYVKASNTGVGDELGSSVAIHGDTCALGAPLEDSNATGIDGDQANNLATDSGAVYVFR